MSTPTILLPLFVQVALTLGLLLWLGYLRNADLKTGAVQPAQIALREPNWPHRTQQVANCFANQFELPVLFYVLTILELVTRHADLVFVVLAWVFVLSRLAHAFEHTTSNAVMRRGMMYGVGMFALIAMWVNYMARMLAGLP